MLSLFFQFSFNTFIVNMPTFTMYIHPGNMQQGCVSKVKSALWGMRLFNRWGNRMLIHYNLMVQIQENRAQQKTETYFKRHTLEILLTYSKICSTYWQRTLITRRWLMLKYDLVTYVTTSVNNVRNQQHSVLWSLDGVEQMLCKLSNTIYNTGFIPKYIRKWVMSR